MVSLSVVYANFSTRVPYFKSSLLRNSIKPWKSDGRSHSTVDKMDVQRHSKLMKEWWDPLGPIKPLHSLNIIRVPFVRDGLLQTPLIGKHSVCLKDFNILDIGCGGGLLTECLARFGAKMTGVDASKDLIDLAKYHSSVNERLKDNMPTYFCTTIEEHVENYSDHYDAVVASEVIEHVTDKELFVESCVRATKPGGKVFFTTPSRTRTCQILGIFFAENILRVIPKGTHQYEKFMTSNELKFLLEMNDCRVESTHGLVYHPWSNKWEWIDSKVFCFAIQATKLSK